MYNITDLLFFEQERIEAELSSQKLELSQAKQIVATNSKDERPDFDELIQFIKAESKVAESPTRIEDLSHDKSNYLQALNCLLNVLQKPSLYLQMNYLAKNFISKNYLNPITTNLFSIEEFTACSYHILGISKQTLCPIFSQHAFFFECPSDDAIQLKREFEMFIAAVAELVDGDRQSISIICYYLILMNIIKSGAELWESTYFNFENVNSKEVAIKYFVKTLPPLTPEVEKKLSLGIGSDYFKFMCWLYSKKLISGNFFVAIYSIISEILKAAKDEDFNSFKIHLMDAERQNSKVSIKMEDIDKYSGVEFEHFVGSLFSEEGYHVEYTLASNDKGVDLIIRKNGYSIGIQCKCYSSSVGISAVQEVFSGKSFYSLDKAIVITNNYFTQAAIDLAKSTGVVLWDRNILEAKISIL